MPFQIHTDLFTQALLQGEPGLGVPPDVATATGAAPGTGSFADQSISTAAGIIAGHAHETQAPASTAKPPKPEDTQAQVAQIDSTLAQLEVLSREIANFEPGKPNPIQKALNPGIVNQYAMKALAIKTEGINQVAARVQELIQQRRLLTDDPTLTEMQRQIGLEFGKQEAEKIRDLNVNEALRRKEQELGHKLPEADREFFLRQALHFPDHAEKALQDLNDLRTIAPYIEKGDLTKMGRGDLEQPAENMKKAVTAEQAKKFEQEKKLREISAKEGIPADPLVVLKKAEDLFKSYISIQSVPTPVMVKKYDMDGELVSQTQVMQDVFSGDIAAEKIKFYKRLMTINPDEYGPVLSNYLGSDQDLNEPDSIKRVMERVRQKARGTTGPAADASGDSSSSGQ